MPKYVSFLRRAESADRDAYLRDVLQAARDLASEPGTEGLTLDLVDVPAEDAGLRPGGSPAFDAVLELWAADDRMAADAVARLVTGLGGEAHPYPAAQSLEKPRDRDWPDGEVSPGIKSLYLMRRHPDLSHDEAVRHWGEVHVPKALKHHVGMWRYARNVFGAPLTPGAQDWDGMAELHFRTSHDLIHRFYDNDEGRAVIAADVAAFSGGGRALHTHEWILKTPVGWG